jgi:Bax protein
MNSSRSTYFSLITFIILGIIPVMSPLWGEGQYRTKHFTSVDQLEEFYEAKNYDLENVREGHYVILGNFPEDFGSIRNVDRRKRYFQRIVLPLIFLENDRIKEERKFLKVVLDESRAEAVTEGKRDQLKSLLDRYDMDVNPETLLASTDYADTLLRRVRQVPPSMVLAQAATESGWGTSRFCRQGNNLFGERTYADDAEGLEPKGVGGDADFTVRTFPNLLDSVRSYMNNLNTHWAYEEFRGLRAQAGPSEGLKLVRALKNYSERKGDYVESIRTVIEHNEFTRFDATVQ